MLRFPREHQARLSTILLACFLVATIAPPRAEGARRIIRKHSPLEVLVLGSGGPRAFGRACTSYVVLVDGVPRILVDAGPGAFLQIGKLGVNVDQLDTVLLTHLHIDHSAGLPGVFLTRALTSNGPIQFKVFGPQGGPGFPSTTKFLHLLFEAGGAFEYQKTFGAEEQIVGVDLSTDLEAPERQIVDADGLRVREIATHHDGAPSVAYRIDYKGGSVTFSGDMDESAVPNLEKLAKGSDLLVFHCAVLDPPGSPAVLYTLHTAPREIGEAAQSAGVKHLLLSHIPPAVEEREPEVLRSIRRSYKGPVEFARDGIQVSATAAPGSADAFGIGK
jgi:ribonuclease BN (tRNA processing enzyme)